MEILCRICGQCLCCKKCRIKHEEIKHNVHPECDICVYGRFILSNPGASLIEHIKVFHMPVHCLRCKKVFTSATDLVSHDKCTVKIERKETVSDKLNLTSDINYDSPPITAFMCKSILRSNKSNYNSGGDVTTSTPMQNNNDRDLMLDNIQEVITPVDAVENNDNVKNLNSVIKIGVTPSITEQSKNGEGALKRRVTFIETPTEYTSKKVHSAYGHGSETSGKQFSSDGNFYCKNLSDDYKYKSRVIRNDNSDTPASCNSENTTYVTASERTHVEILQSPKEEDEDLYDSCIDPVEEQDSTWKSAMLDLDSSSFSESVDQVVQFRGGVSEPSHLADLFTGNIQHENITQLEPNPSIVRKEGIWSSMTNLVKTVIVHGFTSSENLANPRNILKRPRVDSDSIISPRRKRIKLSRIEGRKPIHALKPDFLRYRRKIERLDKSTQTDD